MKELKTYEVNTRFIFTGRFIIRAGSEREAREKVEEDCGLVLGGNIHSDLSDEEVDWDFDMHPTTKVGEITCLTRKKKNNGSKI